MSVRIGVVVFPGSNCDTDAMHAIALEGAEPVALWHESPDLHGVAGVILPGGFSYGDYLRAGALARFSPVMRSVASFAAGGGLVLGICNGFQVLAEAGLVPGALVRNRSLRFVCREVVLVPERLDSPFTTAVGERRPLRMPVAHGEGCYVADDETLAAVERDGQVLFRYAHDDGTPAVDPADPANPNGSLRGIAGVANVAGNVAGLMPHPERAVEALLGSDDGRAIVASLVASAAARSSGPTPAVGAAGAPPAGAAAAGGTAAGSPS